MKNRHKKVSELSTKELQARRVADQERQARKRALVPPIEKQPHEKKPRRTRATDDFIAIDGEGIDVEEEHRYILLMASTGETIQSQDGLSSLSCFQYLHSLAEKHPRSHFCVYGASYDVNMWLRDIPRRKLQQLYGYVDEEGVKHDAAAITWKHYRIKYRARKELWVGVYSEPMFLEDDDGNVKPNYALTFSIWDVIGFFQGAFVKACESYLGNDYPTLDPIKAGKERRSQFTQEELENFIKPYCAMEVETLVVLMNKLRENLLIAGLTLSRWDGAGACAVALLKREGVKEHMEHFPKSITTAAQYAYAGGRIELQYYGNYEKPVYHYDINSAYPAAMIHLPSLKDGKWHHITRNIMKNYQRFSSFSMFKVVWHFDENKAFYPFPFRLKNGNIRYPQYGASWIWKPELDAAIAAGEYLGGTLTIEECYTFLPPTDEKPFHFLPALFEQRAQWKKEGNGAEKALKLAINSLYGKQVQHVGYHATRDKDDMLPALPPYHQLEWGGFVTSWTRATLFNAAMQMPSAIIALATDGIFSMVPLDLPVSSKLGEWDYTEHNYITIVQSGVYFLDTLDKKTGKWVEYAYYRGFDKGSLTREMVLGGYKEKRLSIPVPSTRFITLGSALVSDNMFAKWRSWYTSERRLHLTAVGTKRRDIERPAMDGNGKAHKKLVKTYPEELYFYDIDEQFSTLYSLPWDRGSEERQADRDGVGEKTVEEEITESYY